MLRSRRSNSPAPALSVSGRSAASSTSTPLFGVWRKTSVSPARRSPEGYPCLGDGGPSMTVLRRKAGSTSRPRERDRLQRTRSSTRSSSGSPGSPSGPSTPSWRRCWDSTLGASASSKASDCALSSRGTSGPGARRSRGRGRLPTREATSDPGRHASPEEVPHMTQIPGVQDVLRLEPSPPREPDGEAHRVQLPRRVRVRVRRDYAAHLLRELRLRPGEVHPVPSGVDLHGRAVLSGRLEDLLEVDVDGVALADLSRRRVRQDVHVGVRDGGEHALRLLVAGELHLRVDRGDDVVEVLQDVVRVVHRAVLEDVALRAEEELDPRGTPVEPLYLLLPEADLVRVDPPRDRERLRVLAEADVRVPKALRLGGHLLEGVHAVREPGVRVEVPTDVLVAHQSRERSRRGGRDLPAVLPELRLDVPHPKGLVDALFRLPRHRIVPAEQPVLAELEPPGLGESPEPYVVVLGAGERLQPAAPGLPIEHAKVGLQSTLKDHGGFRVAAHHDALDQRHRRERSGGRRRVVGEDTEVQ